jgi:hypothetical protein
VDAAGNVYIADSDNDVVRKVDTSGIISTIAGTPGQSGFSGDGGPATSAKLFTPWGLALSSSGDLFIADRDDNAIREVNLNTGVISTVAGTGAFGPTGNGGPAIDAELSSPRSIAVDSFGNLYIADTLGNEIRLVAGGVGTQSVTVAPASLTVTANNESKTYGNTFTFTGTEFTTSGLVNGDTVSSVTLTSTGAPATAVVGSYTIVISSAVGTGLSNYTITYVNGTMTVNPASLTITANNATRVAGAPNPTFTVTYSGFVNGDTAASLTTQPVLTTTATTSSPPGTYSIVVSGATAKNYTITFVNGTLTVTAAPTPPPSPVVVFASSPVLQRVPIGSGRTAQAIVLGFTSAANASAIEVLSNYTLTQPNEKGRVRRRLFRNLMYNPTTRILLLFPREDLKFVIRRPARLTVSGQPGGTVTFIITKISIGTPNARGRQVTLDAGSTGGGRRVHDFQGRLELHLRRTQSSA